MQRLTNKGKFKLRDMAVMGRSEFLIPLPPATSVPLAATRQSDHSQAHLQKQIPDILPGGSIGLSGRSSSSEVAMVLMALW